MMPHPLIESRFKAGLFSLERGCSALTAASTLAFRGVVHTKVNAVVLFCFIDKKIFQNVLPVCWGERFFADSAMDQAARKFGVRMHTNTLVV
jgi:hypothetical protein